MSRAEAVEVIGAERCAATLDEAGAKLHDLNRGAEKTSTLVASEAYRRAPRLTGALAASIAPAAEGSDARVRVGVRYGWPVESGVPSHNQAAQPFLADAVNATEPA